MSTSVITATVTDQYCCDRTRTLLGTLAIGAGDYTTGGLAISFAGKHPATKVDPLSLYVYDLAGYQYVYDKSGKLLKIYTGVAATTSTIVDWTEPNVKGADAAVAGSDTTDQASPPTNYQYISALSAIAGGAYTYSETHEIDVPRNVCIVYKNDTGGALNLYQGANSIVVTGTFRGAVQTETITWTATSGNKAIATGNKYRWMYGTKPFSIINTVTMTQPGDNTLKVAIGLGRLMGYMVDGDAGTSADFFKATSSGADVAIAAVDTTNKTVDIGALADGASFSIFYKQKTPGATATGEYAATALPAAITGGTIYFEGVFRKF